MKATNKLVECSEELREVISQINFRKEQEKYKNTHEKSTNSVEAQGLEVP